MIEKGHKKGTVRFAFKPSDGVRRTQLAGDFTDWKPMAMRKRKDGTCVCVVSLSPGTYEYKFIVDGEWQTDTDAGLYSLNSFSTMNSVARIE